MSLCSKEDLLEHKSAFTLWWHFFACFYQIVMLYSKNISIVRGVSSVLVSGKLLHYPWSIRYRSPLLNGVILISTLGFDKVLSVLVTPQLFLGDKILFVNFQYHAILQISISTISTHNHSCDNIFTVPTRKLALLTDNIASTR